MRSPTFTTEQTATMMGIVQRFTALWGVTPKLTAREDCVEANFDNDSEHLGLIELRAWKDHTQSDAPITKVTLQALKLIPSENRYFETQRTTWQ